MTLDQLDEFFEAHEDEYLKEDRVPDSLKPTKQSDLNAMLILAKYTDHNRDIIGHAEHDEVWFDVDADEVAKRATEEELLALIRFGIRLDENGFCAFV